MLCLPQHSLYSPIVRQVFGQLNVKNRGANKVLTMLKDTLERSWKSNQNTAGAYIQPFSKLITSAIQKHQSQL